MIRLVHHNGVTVKKALDDSGQQISIKKTIPVEALFELAETYPEQLLVWCEEQWGQGLEDLPWADLVKNDRIMISYACSGKLFLPEEIGLVDDSVFLKLKNDVRYPTWIMSGDRGAVYAKTFLQFRYLNTSRENLDFFLSSMAKKGMPNGLLCYSEPKLFGIQKTLPKFEYDCDLNILYRFVAAHFKTRWLFLLFFQQWIYQKKIALVPLLKALFAPSGNNSQKLNLKFDAIPQSNNNNNDNNNKKIDVLIPTLGREKYLHQVLIDLKEQTDPPERVIIVEQNPEKNSKSNLYFLKTETWPFAIIHNFIHRVGACNARNLALSQINSDWVFFADDDIRIPPDFLEKTKEFIGSDLAEAFTVSCLRDKEQELFKQVIQWPTFGSGCSFVKAEYVKNLRFDMVFEGGFGEDMDFGMQLRNKGVDVLYNPILQLKHLKAPVGGFRKKQYFPWEQESIQPKPSPTVMAFHLKHDAPFQTLGYKTTLFPKFYRQQKIKNPFIYFKEMKKRWNISKKWGYKLLKK